MKLTDQQKRTERWINCVMYLAIALVLLGCFVVAVVAVVTYKMFEIYTQSNVPL